MDTKFNRFVFPAIIASVAVIAVAQQAKLNATSASPAKDSLVAGKFTATQPPFPFDEHEKNAPVHPGNHKHDTHVKAHDAAPKVEAEEALKKLMAGNKRFASGKTWKPNQSAKRRALVAKGQHPFAVVVTCADSRLTPEFIFDQGIGDIFVVRVAGNTVDETAMGSVEYAVEHLGAQLIVVMGHERCGAVDAAMKGGDLPGSLPAVVKPIQNAVARANTVAEALRLDQAIVENVRDVKVRLAQSPIYGGHVKHGHVKIVGMYYDLDSGVAKLAD